ncbi:MAG: hypothetical protein U0231_15120 [Nitrospiraceae bacterium]
MATVIYHAEAHGRRSRVAAGPFVTTANDITGIAIYLTATIFLGGCGSGIPPVHLACSLPFKGEEIAARQNARHRPA